MRPPKRTPPPTPSVRITTISPELGESAAEHPLVKSIMSNTKAEVEMTPGGIYSPSAEDTMKEDTPTGAETPDILLTLPKGQWLKWLTRRLALFQQGVVEHAESAKRNREHVRSASEAEWQATIETEGITRAVPNEQEIYKWILSQIPPPSEK